MKLSRITHFIAAMLLLTLEAAAQDVNKLYLGDVTGMKSRSVDVPLYVENTNPDVAALQFDIAVPAGVTLSTTSSDCIIDYTRATDHRMSVRALTSSESGRTYRIIMLSPMNSKFKANKGKVATFKASISSTASLEEGMTYPFTVSGAVLSDSLGSNVLTEYHSGSITIGANPDFTISGVQLTGASTVNPQDSVTLKWTVSNAGSAKAQGGFSETVYFVSTVTGEKCQIGTVYHNHELLESGATLNVETKMAVPRIVGLDGSFKVEVKLTPNKDSGEHAEYQLNNTTQSSGSYTLSKKLYISTISSITETDSRKEYSYYIERSGSRKESMTFNLDFDATDDPRFAFEAPDVTLRAGASGTYFSIYVYGTTHLEGDRDYTLSLLPAHNYEKVQTHGKLIDNELPELDLTASEEQVDEGDTFTMTVTITPQASDVKVKLVNAKPSLFSMPPSVTVEAGKSSVTFDVKALDDDIVNDFSDVLFTATAEGYLADTRYVLVNDNDMPTLTMSLRPTTVSEADGPSAILGVITRDKVNSAITIRLSDNSKNGDIYYSTKSITLKKGQSRAEFTIGVVDNELKEGDRDLIFTAGIYIASCNCLAGLTSGGYLQETISIIDNDGPALSIKSKKGNILEGSDNNIFTVTRNDSPDSDLTVNISATGEGLTYPATVTIPAGKTSVDFNVVMALNGESGDSKTITFMASTAQYASGTCWVMSTDQTLPDAQITALNILSADPVVGDSIVIETEISNGGYATLLATMPITLKHSTASTTIYLKEDVSAGGKLVQRDTIPTTTVAGTYYLQAFADEGKAVKEISDNNNSSDRVQLVLTPLFKATAVTDKKKYLNTETVQISGHAEGVYARNAEVEVYILSGNTRYTVSTTTDDHGDYTASWTPVGNLAGKFAVGACTVGEGLTTEMATFDMYGMRRYDKGFILNEIEVGETASNFLHIVNHGTLNLNNLQVTAKCSSASAEVTFTGLSRLLPGEDGRLLYELKGVSPSETRDWDTLHITVTSDEGAVFEHTAYYYVRSAVPVLKANVSEINTTMVKDTIRNYEIVIRNEGRKETGDITLDLGGVDWLRAATPMKMASLAQDEEAVIVLQMQPTPDMELNSITKGNINIVCANDAGISIRMRVETVSSATGSLQIDVWDEFTMNTEEAPHVEGATVNVFHPVTRKLLRQRVTGADGLATFDDLNEGSYIVKVTHPKHSSWEGNVTVDPERTAKYLAFIQYSAISIEMKYEPTEIEDEYNIVTTVKYETNVPKPVVKLDMPDKIILEEIQTPYIFYAHLTNVGLITAADARFVIEDSVNGYYFTPLIEGPWDILPHQTVTVPVEITKKAGAAEAKTRMDGRRRSGGNGAALACGIAAMASFFDQCARVLNGSTGSAEQQVMRRMQVASSCAGGSSYGAFWTGGGGGGGPVGPTGNTYTPLPGTGFDQAGSGTSYVACDPYLTENGPEIIKNMAGAGNPAIGAGFALNDAVNGNPMPLILTMAGPLGKMIPKTPANEELFDILIKIKDLGELMQGLFPKIFDAKKRMVMDEEPMSFEAKRRAGAYEVGEFSLYDKEMYQLYCKEVKRISKEVNVLYEGLVARNKYTETFEEMPLFFQNHSFNQEPAQADTISGEMPEWYPSWLRSWTNDAMIPLYSHYHMLLFLHEVFGDWGWGYITDDEVLKFCDAVQRVQNEEGGLFTYKDMPQNKNYVSIARSILLTRLNNTLKKERGETVEGTNYIDADYLRKCVSHILNARQEAQRKGYEDEYEMFDEINDNLLEIMSNDRSSSCATVTLQLEQKLTMTRQAVRGTLTVKNGSDNAPMKNVKLNLVVTGPYGAIADSRIMEIQTEELKGFTGEKDFESGWELAAGQTGEAKILFIPTKYAAPTEPLLYTFAGSISFIDPFTGLEMTRELEAERLTVNPSPNLELTYFMQRDIMGDDALTKEVEPMVPSQFSVLINNKGYGDATKVKMLTQQPKIVENEKGLMIDFEILSSQLNGGDKTLAMGESVATDFGTIPAHSQAYAQWWLTSTLTGHFVDYDIDVTHVTSYDNPDLSLLDTVHIHELIHQIVIPGATVTPKLLGFLVNDIEDMEDAPDALYKTDGTISQVRIATGATLSKQDNNQYELKVSPSAAGWNYGHVADPTGGKQKLERIVRKSDGAELPLENFWLTDRTLVDKMEPVYENLLHYADSMALAGDIYVLYFEPKPDVELKVVKFSGLPAADTYVSEPVSEVVVQFSKPIDPATFTYEDMKLLCQGNPVSLTGVSIQKVNDLAYKVLFNGANYLDGYYSFTVNTEAVEDTLGMAGEEGKMSGWIQVSDGKANFTMKVYPENAGTVTPGTSLQDYEGTVNVAATPNAGYRFLHWTSDDQVISSDAETTVSLFGPKTVTAVFQPKQHRVSISWNTSRGSVQGAGTGLFDFNQKVTLTAEPLDGYYFVGWKQGESLLTQEAELVFTVSGDAQYEAVFEPLQYVQVFLDEKASDNTSAFEDTRGKHYQITMNRKLSAGQWNTFCVPFSISEQQVNKTWGYATSIVQLTKVVDGAMHFTSVYNIKAGVPYLIKPEVTVNTPVLNYSGNIDVSIEPQQSAFTEASYVGIYTPYEWGSNGSGDEYYYGVKSNSIIKVKPTTADLSGMRAYFVLPQVSSLKIFIDGEAVDITEIGAEPAVDTGIYSLQGIYLGNDTEGLQPGIYIINGKKHHIK